MNELINRYQTLLTDQSGVEAIKKEMERQAADIIKTQASQKSMILALADALRACPRILLLGMGASHLVNEIFALQLRKSGIDALALTASEFLYDPIPTEDKVVLLNSQSGESGETVKCLPMLNSSQVFGITLTAGSTIARKTKAILCAGGGETAYAGTRSVTLSLAALAFVAAELGQVAPESVLTAVNFDQRQTAAMESAIWTLFSKSSIVATGRSLFAPLAHLFALGCEELSTRPVRWDETGTFRHGPMEILNADTALVIFRQSGVLGELCKSFETLQQQTGCKLIVIDTSGQPPLEQAITIACPAGDDIIAALGTMTTFQTLMIAYACGKNPRTGLPKFGSKVTTTE